MQKELNHEMVDRLLERVNENLGLSGNCAQTAFLSLMDEFQLDGGEILKALTPFPGIALRGETCGAVTGSLMAIGLKFGRDRHNLDNWQAYINSLRPSRRFCRSFEGEYGSTMCAEIVEDKFGRPFNLADPQEAMQWYQCGAFEKCGEVIGKGVCLAADILVSSRSRTQDVETGGDTESRGQT
jgi:C_GCAxxG_C_C family probable redox protein